MIRLRTASIVLLAACLLLVQGGAVAVYSSGVTIFVNSGTISSVTPGNSASRIDSGQYRNVNDHNYSRNAEY